MLMESNLWRASLFFKDSYHSLCHMHTMSSHIQGQSQTGIKRKFPQWIDSTCLFKCISTQEIMSSLWNSENNIFFGEMPYSSFKRWILYQSSMVQGKRHCSELERLILTWGTLLWLWVCICPAVCLAPSVRLSLWQLTWKLLENV